MKPTLLVRICATLLLVLELSGCSGRSTTPEPPPPSFPNWPATLDGFRFRWSAEPGIDLTLGPAVFLRAYLESHRVGDMTINPDNVYPGFHRAVPPVGMSLDETTTDLPLQLVDIQPATEPMYALAPPSRFYGNEYFHILQLDTLNTGTFRAYVCDGMYDIFRQGPSPDSYSPIYAPTPTSSDPDRWATKVWRIEFSDQPTPAAPQSPPNVSSPQKGPNPAPSDDVFGTWKLTGASVTGWWGPIGGPPEARPDDAYEQRVQQCRDVMPHTLAQRESIYPSHPTTPPSAEPAVPGWPAGAS